ncbi:MAG: hypothetical protein ACI35M_05960, partial [Alistipes sp.]
IPFPHFFMNISIIGFVRCGVGTAAAGAVVSRLFAWAMGKHVMLSCSESEWLHDGNREWLPQYFAEQNIMLAVKECFGCLALFGLFMSLVVLLFRYSDTMKRFVPRLVSVIRWIKNPRHSADPTLS